ncbi:uncharacterized protein LOC117571470 [Drosophila albomicans]|uniref:Uncharacterized protein LOC117571470 n=1 Tax=Drosophila albomicans TaxID=7291 RepID=A0A6P8XA20_DROAB|nr:uncharacterized protein LOC117571470 [Drosophila albomicans]
MRHPARSIWESASRPLFVRSVWLESSGEKGTRSHRRHFILDYEPRERQRWIQCQRQSARRGINHQHDSCESHDPSTAFEESVDYALDEYLLLDATKLTLQRQQQVGQAQGALANKLQTSFSNLHGRQSSRHAKRRAWLLSSGKSYHLDHLMDYHSLSRRSSLQDAPATSSHIGNPEERLAERVLNWLDLAGRADIVKAATPMASSSNANGSTLLPRSSHRSNRHSHSHRGMSLKRISTAASQRVAAPRKPASAAKQPSPLPPAVNYRSNSSNAKPITIIFNKEGVPVRLNRPARNIDLCALSNSASTTRRLAGHLASARLYNGHTPSPTLEETRTPPVSSRGLNTNQLDSRKQLHIFMPSLPKKGLLLAATTSTDDVLSASFSELCF